INNLIEMLIQEDAYEEVPQYLEILKTEMKHRHKPAQQAIIFYLYSNNSLVYMQRTGQFDKAVELVPDILLDYPKHGKELNQFQKTVLLIKISISWFGTEQ